MAPTVVRDGAFRLSFFSREEARIHGHVARAANLNDSPLVCTAQAMRAFLAAIATTAFQ